MQMNPLKSDDETAFCCAGTMKIGCAHERLDFFQIEIGQHKEPRRCGVPLAALSVIFNIEIIRFSLQKN